MPTLTHETRTFQCVAIVTPGESVPGSWIAHCLDYDVAAQADDPDVAVRLVAEATAIAIADDLSEGLDPDGRKAPPEEWRKLEAALSGTEISKEEAMRAPVANDGRVAVMVASFVLVAHRREMMTPATIFQPISRAVDRSAVAMAC